MKNKQKIISEIVKVLKLNKNNLLGSLKKC